METWEGGRREGWNMEGLDWDGASEFRQLYTFKATLNPPVNCSSCLFLFCFIFHLTNLKFVPFITITTG